MTCTFAGQYVMNGFLNLKWSPWQRTLLTRTIALGPALLVSLFASTDFDDFNEWINVLLSIILPFSLLPLLFFNCNTRIMGNEFALGFKMRIFYTFIGIILIVTNVYLVCLFIDEWPVNGNQTTFIIKWFVLSAFLWIYLGIIVWLLYDFWKQKSWKQQPDIDNMTMHIDESRLQQINQNDDDNDKTMLLSGGGNTTNDENDDNQDENIEMTQNQPLLGAGTSTQT